MSQFYKESELDCPVKTNISVKHIQKFKEFLESYGVISKIGYYNKTLYNWNGIGENFICYQIINIINFEASEKLTFESLKCGSVEEVFNEFFSKDRFTCNGKYI